ncbi:MAG: HAD-IC family P-type ATPase [Gammaproteobacteria bacterium]|nr:HAD-IC family P-type ATPase [Gammaproteobacteria bacterium]
MRDYQHEISLDDLFRGVKSSEKGLTSYEVKERLEQFGANVFSAKPSTPLIIKFLKHFTNFFALLLICGSILAFIAEYLSPGEGNVYIGVALLVVVFLNAVFTFLQEYQSEKIMQSFAKMMPVKIEVLRDGKSEEILASELVPGDVIFLKAGDKIPADGRLLEINALKVDNSSLTGESEPQLRSLDCTHDSILESRNMVFSGTLVQSGAGTALVYGTGMHTQIGRIAHLTKITSETLSPLKKELNYFIKIISVIAIILGITFFIISLFLDKYFMASMVFAIGIIVANVPEGLLPTVTLALSMTAKRMAKKNALIKNLESVETLGSTTVICTDKTGTITENNITVNSLFFNMDSYSKTGEGAHGIPSKLLEIAVLCNNSVINEDGSYRGDPTETALTNFAAKFIDVEKLRATNERLNEYPFDSKTKHMVTLDKWDHSNFANMKGAPEIVLSKCDRVLIGGKAEKLTDEYKHKILSEYESIASSGERVLALAYKENGSKEVEESGFIFVALIGMLDPPRAEIPGAIAKCKSAGIKVIMVTGDYSLTAEAVARKAGMLDGEKANILTGEELKHMSSSELKEFLKGDDLIFARTSPRHKMEIVRLLQDMGEVVTVTGDGVNDAPALKNADMGVAMGVVGTEVAKEAANMVLLDDNFATIVKAIEEGRTIFENIKKFVGYILTSNIPEIVPFIAFVLLRIPLPLTVVLILAIDLGTDLLPALGLAVEKSEDDVMQKPPRSRRERLLTWSMLVRSYGVIGPLEAAAGFVGFFTILYRGGWQWGQKLAYNDPTYLQAVSAFFAAIILCQIVNVMVCRTRRVSLIKQGFFKNRFILVGILSELILLSIIIYNPYSHKFFSTAVLLWHDLLFALPFMLLIFVIAETRKFLVRKGFEIFSW